MGSGLRAVAPRCLSREKASRAMTALHHALCGDDFDQTPVSIIFREKCSKFFVLLRGRCNTDESAPTHSVGCMWLLRGYYMLSC